MSSTRSSINCGRDVHAAVLALPTDERLSAIVVQADFVPFFALAGQQDTPADPGCQAWALSAEVTGFATHEVYRWHFRMPAQAEGHAPTHLLAAGRRPP